MTAFVDNDVVHKLAATCLLTHLSSAIQSTELIVLPTAKYKFGIAKSPEKSKARYGEATFERIETFLCSSKEAAGEADATDLAAFNGVMGIDAGEAILFSVASRTPGAILATGDKLSLIALASASSCVDVLARLKGRVVCFEQIVLRSIELRGFSNLLPDIVAGYACDASLRVAFGSGLKSNEANVKLALETAIRALREKSGGLLSP